MSVIFILIGCGLLLASGFLVAFIWANKSGQFEDDYTPSVRMLFEDEATLRANPDISSSARSDFKKAKKNSSNKT